MRTIEITKAEIVTPILASAALIGDFTRRGAIIGDNDSAALEALLDVVVLQTVPCVFSGVETVNIDGGWRLTGLPDDISAPGVKAFVRESLLNLLVPDKYPPAEAPSPAIPRLRPQW